MPEGDGFVKDNDKVSSGPGLTLPLTLGFVLTVFKQEVRRAWGVGASQKVPVDCLRVCDKCVLWHGERDFSPGVRFSKY